MDKIWSRNRDCINLPNIKSVAKLMRFRWAMYVALIRMKERKFHSERHTRYDKPVTMDKQQLGSDGWKRIYLAHNHDCSILLSARQCAPLCYTNFREIP